MVLSKKNKIIEDEKILGSGRLKIGKKVRIMELKWMFKFCMYLTYDSVLIMIRIGLNIYIYIYIYIYKFIVY